MERIEKSIEVNCPVRTVYNQWTQFEEFPKFMSGVKEVRQIDDTHVHWHAEIWGKDEEWDAEITEQVPDERISWQSISGAPSSGTVRFHRLGPDLTAVRLVMAYEPEGAIENVGDALGLLRARVQETVEDFKEFIEKRGQETGGWRGEVHDSKITQPSEGSGRNKPGSQLETSRQQPPEPGEENHEERKLDTSIEESFPTSDPPSTSQPAKGKSRRKKK
jgi:ribosome-associated toxin RatA of RatAB toxin-antitoxin module